MKKTELQILNETDMETAKTIVVGNINAIELKINEDAASFSCSSENPTILLDLAIKLQKYSTLFSELELLVKNKAFAIRKD